MRTNEVHQHHGDFSNSCHINSEQSVETASTVAMSADEMSKEEAVRMFNASKGDRDSFDFDYEDGKAPSYDELDWIPETSDVKANNPTAMETKDGASVKKKLHGLGRLVVWTGNSQFHILFVFNRMSEIIRSN